MTFKNCIYDFFRLVSVNITPPGLLALAVMTLCVNACSPGGDYEIKIPHHNPFPASSITRVYIIAGQSNAAGLGSIYDIDTTLWITPRNVIYYDRGSWGGLIRSENFGPEITLARAMAAGYPDDRIGIIKCACGGSDLEAWDTWLYDLFMANLENALADTSAPVCEIFWMQGESAAKSEQKALAYASDLSALFTRMRADLGDIPITVGMISQPLPFTPEIRAAQIDVFHNLENITLVETIDLCLCDDLIHFNSFGQAILGERFSRVRPLTP